VLPADHAPQVARPLPGAPTRSPRPAAWSPWPTSSTLWRRTACTGRRRRSTRPSASWPRAAHAVRRRRARRLPARSGRHPRDPLAHPARHRAARRRL